MIKNLITIFTPTYNRAHLLQNLYGSLLKQTNKNFHWLIYDDGSSDNTEEVVQSFIKEDIINIKYIKAENRGKHVAINNGVEAADGELFFIVDSDDIITDDAIEYITKYWNTIPETDKHLFAGLGALKSVIGNEQLTKKLNKEYIDATYIDFAFKFNHNEDKADIFRTEILKKYKFPVFENENFMTEAVVWFKMANDGYKMRWFNHIIYLFEYRDDGLTQNSFRVRLKNLNGTCHAYNLLSSYKLPIKNLIRYKANYFRFGFHKKLNIHQLKKELLNKKYWIIASILGWSLYKKDIK
jgi:glycosyltransferase involved in cell wall biosynthesis